MPAYRIFYSPHFKRKLKKLNPQLQKNAKEKVKLFRKDPFNSKLKSHKLKGKFKDYWSFSVTHSYRVVFRFLEDNRALLVDIDDHSVYR